MALQAGNRSESVKQLNREAEQTKSSQREATKGKSAEVKDAFWQQPPNCMVPENGALSVQDFL
ncbi:hypothetical protein NQZ68_025235 [Dissostichus eleginoides]|nr:hypothetical protein NQZ68_025235 [Dissostichus eleginoides]